MRLQQMGFLPTWQEQLGAWPTAVAARIARMDRSVAVLWSADGEHELDLTLYPRKYEISVGDWLLIEQQPDGQWQGQALLPRFSCISRRAAGERADHQLIAANVNTLFIVSSCNADFSLERLERYLVLALDAGVTPVVLLTKADEADAPNTFVTQAQALQPGLKVLAINALDADHTQALQPWCGAGQTIALVGSSGVGKSTVTNQLCASPQQATQQAREGDAKGRHTTVARSLHRLAAGGFIIDTPGMRELQLPGCADGVDALFTDVTELLGQCRFNDCAHQAEPGCAIRAAIENGRLEERRWRSFEKLQHEQQVNAQSIAQRRDNQRQGGRAARNAQRRVRSRERRD